MGAPTAASGDRPARHGTLFSWLSSQAAAGRHAILRVHCRRRVAQRMLSLQGVRKSYGNREVVCGVDLELRAGECFGLLGPNGAGKTTTLRLALGLSDPDSGIIELLDYPIPQRAREARVRVGVLPQLDNLDPDFTVCGESAGLRPLLRLGRCADRAAHPRAAAVRRSGRPCRFAHSDAVGRHEAPPFTRSRSDQRSGSDRARRADNRPGSAGAPPDLGTFEAACRTRQDHPADHALHGRSRTSVSSRCCDGQRQNHRARLSARVDRAPHRAGRWSKSSAMPHKRGPTSQASWCAIASSALVRRCSATLATMTACWRRSATVRSLRYLHRRANLEDVFLKLTGRDLRD